jgi:hypothetical protein
MLLISPLSDQTLAKPSEALVTALSPDYYMVMSVSDDYIPMNAGYICIDS